MRSGAWITDGRNLAQVDDNCVVLCPPMAIPGLAPNAVATGLYVGAGWGPGPRDGLMTGMAKRGVPVAAARAAVELTVLAAGWLLGGTVGVATVLFATSIGPLVKPALAHLAISDERERTNCAYASD